MQLQALGSVATLAIAASTSGNVALSAFEAREDVVDEGQNSVTSSATNLDMFMSRSVRIARYTSDLSGLLRFEEPIVRNTDRIFRRPKS